MKKIIVLALSILAVTVGAVASDFGAWTERQNATMRRLAEGCTALTRGVAAHDDYLVALAADALAFDDSDGEMESPSLLRATAADTSGIVEPRGCFEFTRGFAERWYATNGADPYLENPSTARGGKSKECRTRTFRLAPGSEVTYTVDLRGKCNFFAAYEPGTEVSVDVNVASPIHDEESRAWFASWELPGRQAVKVMFRNSSSKASTIIMAFD